MSIDGLIYAVIVGLWAVVLVPMWLRRHDASTEARSVDRFSTAMRILSRRTPARPDQRYIVMPARPDPDESPRVAAESRPVAPSDRPAVAGRARLAARRRRVLGGLLVLLLLAAVLSLVGVISALFAVALLVLSACYVVHLRIQARRALELDRRRGASQRRVDSRRRRTTSQERLGAARERLTSRGEPAFDEERAADVADDLAADGWHPMPLPLPTYVTAPKATRPVRTIDLTTPGLWTSGNMSADEPNGAPPSDLAGDGAAASVLDEPDDLDDILERRPAVND